MEIIKEFTMVMIIIGIWEVFAFPGGINEKR